MKALWAPFEVRSLPESSAFYESALGLRVLERFEGGVVFEVGAGGRLEIVAPQTSTPPPQVALEVGSWADVDSLFARVSAQRRPTVFPRGHYGFVARDPDGHELLIWSEK